jgi:hypothetical protein
MAKRLKSPAAVVAPDSTYESLRRFNSMMALLHLVQSTAMVLLSNNTAYPVYTNYLKFDRLSSSLMLNAALAYRLPFGQVVAVFLLISAAAHLFLSSTGYAWYVRNLKLGKNPARFCEYALSSSLMIVLIGMLVGVWDLGALIGMFAVNACMNLFGLLMEELNQHTEQTNWAPFVFGCLAGIVPWIVITMHFLGALSTPDTKPPAFVYAIIPTIFVFFNIFAINMYLQYKKVGRWKDYLFGERVYIVLSLLAKSALAWMIFAGTLAPIG